MTRCKICRAEFERRSMSHKACSPGCALALATKTRLAEQQKAARIERRHDAAARMAIKPRAKLASEAQAEVNRYARLRDAALPCVSCQRPATWDGQWHAGHYRSTGARPDLRFDLANIHKQCSPCNLHLSGNLIGYRAELVRRVGQTEVDRLEGPPLPARPTRDQLIHLKIDFRARARALSGACADDAGQL